MIRVLFALIKGAGTRRDIRMLLKNLAYYFLPLLLLAPFASADQGQYTIGPGDVVSVSVFGEPDLTVAETKVSGDGRISMPLIGQVKAKGQTVSQLERRLENLLKDGYMKDPKVTVAILAYRPFYVYGEVNTPGSYPYKDGLTVEKAIALAGGLTPRASKRKITLKREVEGEKKREVKGKKKREVKGKKKQEVKGKNRKKRVNLKTEVKPGDVITVGESFF